MALGAGIASAVMSGSSAYGSTKLSNVQNKYSAKMNTLNANLANQQAESALRRGEKEQQQIMTKGAKVKGAQKVAYGANGIDLSSRSAQNVMNETDYFTEADRLQTAANAINEAWNYRLQAAQYQGQAMIDKSNIHSALKSALASGLQSGLMTYVMAGGKFDEFANKGFKIENTFQGNPADYGFQFGGNTSNTFSWDSIWNNHQSATTYDNFSTATPSFTINSNLPSTYVDPSWKIWGRK